MNNVINFNSKNKNPHEINQIIKAAVLICPCRNNTFTLSFNQRPEQIKCVLQCTTCNQAFDATQLLTEMLDKDKTKLARCMPNTLAFKDK